MYSKNKGITLIPLVITIILLLILSGISIRALGGESGLITRTKIAKEENKKSEYKDYLSIAKTEAIVKKGGVEVTLDEYIEQIKADKIEGIKSIEKITNDKASVITKEGYIFIITVNTIEYYENENTLPEMDIKDANIEFAFDPNTWTNGNVEVTVSKKESKYTLQLSKDAEKWTTTNKMTFEENGEIYARLIDELGRTSDIASRKITKIDKDKPVITELTPSTNSVRIKATDDAAGIIGYAVITTNTEPTEFIECESTKEIDVIVEDLTQGTTYYAWVKDAAGNVSAGKSTATGNVTGLEIKVNTTNWSTSKTITITATNNNYSNIKYTTDGTIPTSTTGTAYTAAFTIKSNCTITAIAFDSTGQPGSAATNKITTIDTQKPVVTDATSNTNGVRIKATDNAAGIIGYAVTTSNTTPTKFTECSSRKSLDITVQNLKQGTTYFAWVKDNAGNISTGKSTQYYVYFAGNQYSGVTGGWYGKNVDPKYTTAGASYRLNNSYMEMVNVGFASYRLVTKSKVYIPSYYTTMNATIMSKASGTNCIRMGIGNSTTTDYNSIYYKDFSVGTSNWINISVNINSIKGTSQYLMIGDDQPNIGIKVYAVWFK